MEEYHVYMLECRDGSFYVGVTSDVEKRIGQHHYGAFETCYTYARRPLKLVFATAYPRIDDAIRFEKQLKGWSRAKKRALIASDWPGIQRLASRADPSRRTLTRAPQDDSGAVRAPQDDSVAVRAPQDGGAC